MKTIMRKRFVPSHYYRELYQRLQRLNQGFRSVDEYYKEMEVAMVRANIEEDREATMARFLSGLNSEIANVVELHHYVELEDMVHMAIKVEGQFKRRNNRMQPQRPIVPTPWVQDSQREEGTSSKPRFEVNKGKEMEASKNNGKGKVETFPRNRDVSCFRCLGKGHIASQCPNKKAMIMQANGEVATDEDSDGEEMPPLEEASAEEIVPVKGDLLMVGRVHKDRSKESDMDSQRRNIFHTRCHVNGKVCNLIIDGGCCTNIASTTLVEKLGLPTTTHPTPYKLQWLNDQGEVKVEHQVLVSFAMGNYQDNVLCDVVAMQVGHMILGRPWQYDRRVTYDGYKNKYSFDKDGSKITLIPLTPKEVVEDQLKINNKGEQEKGKGKEKEEMPKEKSGQTKKKEEKKKMKECLFSYFSFLQDYYDEEQNRDGLLHLPHDEGPKFEVEFS